jgi:hypothetical protein
MTKEDKFNKALAEDLAKVKRESIKIGSPAHEAYLAAGYPEIGTEEHAKEIISEREKDHSAYPWDVYQKAKAFLDALHPKPGSQKPYHPATDALGQVVFD